MTAQSNESTSEKAKGSNKLKTCPMCGNSGYILTEYHATDYTAHWVQCDCGAKGVECETNDNAIEHWNNRPEEDRLKARVKQCEYDALMADKHREKIIAQHDGLKARIEELEGLLEDAVEYGRRLAGYHGRILNGKIIELFFNGETFEERIKNWRAKK